MFIYKKSTDHIIILEYKFILIFHHWITHLNLRIVTQMGISVNFIFMHLQQISNLHMFIGHTINQKTRPDLLRNKIKEKLKKISKEVVLTFNGTGISFLLCIPALESWVPPLAFPSLDALEAVSSTTETA